MCYCSFSDLVQSYRNDVLQVGFNGHFEFLPVRAATRQLNLRRRGRFAAVVVLMSCFVAIGRRCRGLLGVALFVQVERAKQTWQQVAHAQAHHFVEHFIYAREKLANAQ